MATKRIAENLAALAADESGLVSAMEMTIGIMLTFVLIVSAILLIAYSIMGTMVDDAALVSARAGSQFFFPSQATQATQTAQQVFAKAIPASQEVSCAALTVTTPAAPGRSFSVSSVCSVDMGTFLGRHIATTWTAKASVPVGPYSVVG